MRIPNRLSPRLTWLGLAMAGCFSESGTAPGDGGAHAAGGHTADARTADDHTWAGPDGDDARDGRVVDGAPFDNDTDARADGTAHPDDATPDAAAQRDQRTPAARVPFECRYGTRVEVGTVAANAGALLIEASGLIQSRTNPDIFWSHNDNGNDRRLFALNRDGTYLATFELDIGPTSDIEDLAMGPGPIPGRNYLYLGDVGANWRIWGCAARNADTGDCAGCLTIPARCGGTCDCHMRDLYVFRIEEPHVDPHQAFSAVSGVAAETITLQFPASMMGQRQDVEAMMVDPLSGDLFVATKHTTPGRLFRAAAPLSTAQPMVMESVVDLPWGGDNQATAADISSDGRLIGVRRYGDVHIWERPLGATVAQAIQSEGCRIPAGEQQGESFAFDTDDSGSFYSLSESVGAATVPLYYYPRE